MRYLLLILSCIPFFASAQALTETQKQEALQCATRFCDLLVRFSNGERMLNTEIFALCSGADCSAFDDIKTNTETTLRNYLMAIQRQYPAKLEMQLSKPTFSACEIYQEYDFSVSGGYSAFTGEQYLMAMTPQLEHDRLLNTVIVFNVEQKLPSLGKSTERKLIYSRKSGKITAFVCKDSPVLSYSKGLDAFAKQEYKKALSYFEEAVNNGGKKFSMKKDCYMGAYLSCVMSLDFKAALNYANLLGDIGYILSIKGQIALQEGRYMDAFQCYRQLESELLKGAESYQSLGGVYYMLGLFYSMPKANFPDADSKKAAYYLKKSVEANEDNAVEAAYMIYVAWNIYQSYSIGISDEDMTYSEALSYLKIAAEKNYPPAFFCLALEEYNVGNKKEAVKWYERSAETGNTVTMAILGKILATESEFSFRKEEGIKWLEKSLEGDRLEKDIENLREFMGLELWPASREDVRQLIRQVSSNAGGSVSYNSVSHTDNVGNNHSNIQSHPSSQSHTSMNNYNHTNTGSLSDSHVHTYSSHQFNEAKDKYCVGLSAGYVQKQWVYDWGDTKEKMDVFGEDQYTNGVQFGLRIDPQFGYGFGINTGLYYEYYFDKSENLTEEGIDYHYTSEEHSLYMPVHLKYSLNFSKWFQLAFYGGIGLDYGIKGRIYLRSDGETFDSQNLYDKELDMKHFNASLEYGAALRINRFQLNFTMSKGFVNMSGSEEYKVKQNKLMNIGATVYF